MPLYYPDFRPSEFDKIRVDDRMLSFKERTSSDTFSFWDKTLGKHVEYHVDELSRLVNSSDEVEFITE